MPHHRAVVRTLIIAAAIVILSTQWVVAARPRRLPVARISVSTDGKLVADQGGVSAESPLAVRAGLEMLQRGANDVDTMVATALAMAVVRNGANGLGG